MSHSIEQDRAAEVVAAAQPGISAIVVSYFTGPLLTRCVDSLKAQPEIDEIILVDNGNFPGDVAQAAANSGAPIEIEVLTGHGNIGFAAACNKGAAIAKNDYLLFLNPDAMMPKGGAAQFLKDAKKLERPWLTGAMIVGPDGEEQQGSRRTTLTPWRAFVEATRLYKFAPHHPYFSRFNLHTDDCPDGVVSASTISGACFFLPKADYAMIGGMDERYFLHVEDVDFCLRFRKAGGEVYFDPHVRVIHYKSSSRANPVRIEARKTASLVRYFNIHFADAYPKPFLWAVGGLMWLSLAALFLRRAAGKAVRLAGLRRRTGERGVKRARTIAARRSAR